MIISVGQLHSSVRLLDLTTTATFSTQDILVEASKVVVCPAEIVLNLSLRCGWLEADSNGYLSLTQRGKQILATSLYEERLREQLVDVISLQPTWGKLVMHGRRELNRNAPSDICQCFQEARMMEDDLDDARILWWDKMAGLVRGYRGAHSIAVGRRGEKLTFEYEMQRTNKKPLWQSLETNFSGYDVLSVVDASNPIPLSIEVKASENKMSAAKFHISANEWISALNARAHAFHLWILRDRVEFAVLSIDDIIPHIPLNQGNGLWEQVEIAYNLFVKKFNSLS